MTIGQRIHAARMALGLTQRELGELLLTDQTTVSAWEKGKSKNATPAGPSLVALAEVLQTTPDALVTGTGFKVPEWPSSQAVLSLRGAEEKVVVPMPLAPPEGHLAWVDKGDPGSPRILEEKEALAEIKRALAAKRKVWLLVD